MVWQQSAQEGNHELSLILCRKAAIRGKSPHLDWPPEEVVSAESWKESGFRGGQELKRKFSDVIEDITEFPGLQGAHGKV